MYTVYMYLTIILHSALIAHSEVVNVVLFNQGELLPPILLFISLNVDCSLPLRWQCSVYVWRRWCCEAVGY